MTKSEEPGQMESIWLGLDSLIYECCFSQSGTSSPGNEIAPGAAPVLSPRGTGDYTRSPKRSPVAKKLAQRRMLYSKDAARRCGIELRKATPGYSWFLSMDLVEY
ncbi:hypothetical protein TWF718_010939 [Orbilia javanica]|uniref:Uncharacterized protein n=1 Tax=Orbilia javanica TaxID=47235 RepID=A0AAN8NN46_9PEZI